MAARILLVCLLSLMIITRAIGLPKLVGIKVGMILILSCQYILNCIAFRTRSQVPALFTY